MRSKTKLEVRNTVICYLGPPVVPFYPFLREGSPTKTDVLEQVGTNLF